MKSNLFIYCLIILGMFTACQNMDINPPNIMTDEAIYNEGGIEAYMAGLYSRLPMEDFNRSSVTKTKTNGVDVEHNGFFYWNNIAWDQCSTGESVNRNNTGMVYMNYGYWKDGYQIIRQANNLIENLPAYIGTLEKAEEWIAEARFIRAYTYFFLVKSYGGVPIVDKTQQIGADESTLWVARNSHQESYDFILEDLDYAIANMPATSSKGRGNKYVAAALKSRAALFAGSIARYGATYDYEVDGVMLTGLPAETANDYFKQAWDASKIVDEGGYALYQGNGDKSENFAEVFQKANDTKESVFIRQYDFINYVHSYDCIYSPPRMASTYGDRFNPTVDWMELFDGLPIDPATGKLKTTDDADNYIVYEGPDGLFANAEPRLRGSILLPGHTYKTVELDIRRGIIKEEIDPSTPIQKFVPDDYSSTAAYGGSWFNANVAVSSQTVTTQTPYERPSDKLKLNMLGMDGPKVNTNNTITGLHGRKWLDMTLTPATTKLHSSFQSWIDIRYAEVLLNRAEAALELAQNGDATYAGVDMQEDAFNVMNMVRARAGATLLTAPSELNTMAAYPRGGGPGGFVQAPNRGLQLIRVERYKELAFEHKIYWDLIRWFTFDTQIYNYRRRMISPFLFAKGATVNGAGNPVGKYIYDVRVSEKGNKSNSFDVKYYYQAIPGGELKVNPLLEQNNQY